MTLPVFAADTHSLEGYPGICLEGQLKRAARYEAFRWATTLAPRADGTTPSYPGPQSRGTCPFQRKVVSRKTAKLAQLKRSSCSKLRVWMLVSIMLTLRAWNAAWRNLSGAWPTSRPTTSACAPTTSASGSGWLNRNPRYATRRRLPVQIRPRITASKVKPNDGNAVRGSGAKSLRDVGPPNSNSTTPSVTKTSILPTLVTPVAP